MIFSTIQFLCHVQYTEKFSISQYLTLWSLVSQQLMDRFAKLNKQTCCKFSDLYKKNVFKECPSRIIFQKGQKLEKNHKKNVWMPVTRKRWVVPKFLESTFWLQIWWSFRKKIQKNFWSSFWLISKNDDLKKNHNSAAKKVTMVDSTAKVAHFSPLKHIQKLKKTKLVYFCNSILKFLKKF